MLHEDGGTKKYSVSCPKFQHFEIISSQADLTKTEQLMQVWGGDPEVKLD